MHELASNVSKAHQFSVYLVVAEYAYTLFLRHLIFIQAVPYVCVNEVRALDIFSVVRGQEGCSAFLAVLFDLRQAGRAGAVLKLMSLRSIVYELHAQLCGDHCQGCANLCRVAYEYHLAVFQFLSSRKVLNDRTEVADLLGRMIVIRHSVEYRDGAGTCQVSYCLVLDHTRHYDIDQLGQNLSCITDGLVSA